MAVFGDLATIDCAGERECGPVAGFLARLGWRRKSSCIGEWAAWPLPLSQYVTVAGRDSRFMSPGKIGRTALAPGPYYDTID